MQAAMNLAHNVTFLRKRRNLSQQRLAELANIPRSTITNIESGGGNPLLSNLGKLSAALGVGIEELLAPPRGDCRLIPAAEVPSETRGNGRLRVFNLLPERVRGLEITRMAFEPTGSMRGTPHVTGTKEYLHVLEGRVTVLVAGRVFDVGPGDVLAFPGDQPHSYANREAAAAVALSVVVPIPVTAGD
ncbi:MAG TPA: helix-turn-helix domain-containing protein [Gammaproteobacteria bacterium]|nr:helix-turn-helix domain-containing protein [Gammaproteobacteria bacterium]